MSTRFLSVGKEWKIQWKIQKCNWKVESTCYQQFIIYHFMHVAVVVKSNVKFNICIHLLEKHFYNNHNSDELNNSIKFNRQYFLFCIHQLTFNLFSTTIF